MVATLLLTRATLWIPPDPPFRKPLPQCPGVEFRIDVEGEHQVGKLVNRTGRRIDWTTGGYMVAAFAQPVDGGAIVTDDLWPTWKRPQAVYKTETFSLPAHGSLPWGRRDLAAFLRLRPGRYHVWEIFYPAFETEKWLTSNALVVDVAPGS